MELNNQKLLNQCQRIKNLISQAAKTEVGKNMYGAGYHNYKLKPPVPFEEIRSFEMEHQISFPEEYVYFLTQVGSAGAGPGNGFIYDYKQNFYPDDTLKWINTPSEQLENEISDEEWDKKYGGEFFANLTEKEKDDYFSGIGKYEQPRGSGTIILTAMDTTYLAHLIFTGKNRGKIVYLDWDEDYPPVWAKSSPNFLDWCENWFKEIVAGYYVKAGSFMYYEIGTQEELIQSFYQAKNEKYKTEVLYSFNKFPSLNNSTIDFLKQQEGMYKEVVQYVLKKT